MQASSSVVIRPATTTDVTAVLPMVAKICALHEAWDSAKYGFLPDPAKRYQRWLTSQATDDRSVFLVAELIEKAPQSNQQTNALVGFLIATIEQEIPIYRVREFAFIHDLWVEPEYRKAGIARQLVMQTVDRFTQLGIQQIRLDVADPNNAALHLFKACGFRVSTRELLMELPNSQT